MTALHFHRSCITCSSTPNKFIPSITFTPLFPTGLPASCHPAPTLTSITSSSSPPSQSINNPILIQVYPHKRGWQDLRISNSNLSNSHSPTRSIQASSLSKPTLLLSSTCIFLGRLRLLLPFTSNLCPFHMAKPSQSSLPQFNRKVKIPLHTSLPPHCLTSCLVTLLLPCISAFILL